MDIVTFIQSAFLGLLEGLTEFIPVSSTGHIILAGHFIGFESPKKVFEILIQLGAILAILTVYAAKLTKIVFSLPYDPSSRRFVASVLIAFIPAAVIGALAHDFIEGVLLESPMTICVSLIIGGFVLLFVDRLAVRPRYDNAMRYPLWLCLCVGFCQCLAMIPGVSRSGSTIVGALLLGADKRSAAEFSFFLAMPTMLGAFTFTLFKHYRDLSLDNGLSIAVGFIVAFISGVFVVRKLLDYVSSHGYVFFAWWRIIVGLAGLAGLWLVG